VAETSTSPIFETLQHSRFDELMAFPENNVRLAHRFPRNVRSPPAPSLCSSLFGNFCLVFTILYVSFERIGRGRYGRCCAAALGSHGGVMGMGGMWQGMGGMMGAGAGAGRGRPGMNQGPAPARVTNRGHHSAAIPYAR